MAVSLKPSPSVSKMAITRLVVVMPAAAEEETPWISKTPAAVEDVLMEIDTPVVVPSGTENLSENVATSPILMMD